MASTLSRTSGARVLSALLPPNPSHPCPEDLLPPWPLPSSTPARFPRCRRRWLLVLRGVLGFLSVSSLYLAVSLLPLADASVLSFLSPIFVAMLGCAGSAGRHAQQGEMLSLLDPLPSPPAVTHGCSGLSHCSVQLAGCCLLQLDALLRRRL